MTVVVCTASVTSAVVVVAALGEMTCPVIVGNVSTGCLFTRTYNTGSGFVASSQVILFSLSQFLQLIYQCVVTSFTCFYCSDVFTQLSLYLLSVLSIYSVIQLYTTARVIIESCIVYITFPGMQKNFTDTTIML